MIAKRIIRATGVTLVVGTGDDARTVDLFQGDELPDGVPAEEIKRLEEHGALQPAGEPLPAAVGLEGQAPSESPQEPPADPPKEPDLSKLRRGQLNELAAKLGVDEPDKLPNAGGVIEAIKAKQLEAESSQGDGASSGEGDGTPQS